MDSNANYNIVTVSAMHEVIGKIATKEEHSYLTKSFVFLSLWEKLTSNWPAKKKKQTGIDYYSYGKFDEKILKIILDQCYGTEKSIETFRFASTRLSKTDAEKNIQFVNTKSDLTFSLMTKMDDRSSKYWTDLLTNTYYNATEKKFQQ